jgi:hypothetical protein
MGVLCLRRCKLIPAMAAILVFASFGTAAQETNLTKEQMAQFLLSAKVLNSKSGKKGTTNPPRLTLNDGTLTHDASFETIEVHKNKMEFADGSFEYNFVDSYKYNIAAYGLAELLGIEDMLPVYVERRVNGSRGSLSWWLPVKMDEGERLKRKIFAPDADAWNKQMYRIRVFDELVYDTDANLTNVLVGEDWQIWRIDFTRAFRLRGDVKDYKNLVQCDRRLFEKLKALDQNEITQKTKDYLTKSEVEAVMARRDKIVAYFQKLIAEKGEKTVLY